MYVVSFEAKKRNFLRKRIIRIGCRGNPVPHWIAKLGNGFVSLTRATTLAHPPTGNKTNEYHIMRGKGGKVKITSLDVRDAKLYKSPVS